MTKDEQILRFKTITEEIQAINIAYNLTNEEKAGIYATYMLQGMRDAGISGAPSTYMQMMERLGLKPDTKS